MRSRQKVLIAFLALAFLTVLFAGCGSTAGSGAAETAEPAAVTDTAEPETEAVQVSTVDELLTALAPDTTIRLAPGVYDLTEASDYGRIVGGRYYTWENNGISADYGLRVMGADGLTLLGGDGVEIVTEPRSVDVLTFLGCDDLTLQGLTVGHTEAAEACEGGVIRLEECGNVSLDHCSLYGCGTVGIITEDVNGLTVTDCDVYHCSGAAYSFIQSLGCTVTGGSVHDLGTSGAAQAVLYVYGTRVVTLDGVDIHDNTVTSLIGGSDDDTVTLTDCSVTGNRISALFACEGNLTLSNLTVEDNVIGQWYSMTAMELPTIRLDDSVTEEEELDLLWGEQLASAGIGEEEVTALTPDYSGTAEIHVTTADEFYAALISDTTIYIDVPLLDLTDVLWYADAAERSGEEWTALTPADFTEATAYFHPVYDGAELVIGGVQNLHIVGREDGGTRIVTDPRYANVLSFYGCDNVTLEDVTLGHTEGEGYCTGGVLYFDSCRNTVLLNCDLYGCGTYGIDARDCDTLQVQASTIHDCTYGAAVFYDCDNTAFIGSLVENCPSPQLTLSDCFRFTWDGTLMDPNCSFDKGTVSAVG